MLPKSKLTGDSSCFGKWGPRTRDNNQDLACTVSDEDTYGLHSSENTHLRSKVLPIEVKSEQRANCQHLAGPAGRHCHEDDAVDEDHARSAYDPIGCCGKYKVVLDLS